MKYLKYFEEEYKKKLWLVRTDSPYLEISLNKLNLPQKQKDFILNNEYITGQKKYYDPWFDKYYIIKKAYIADSNYRIEDYIVWEPYKSRLKHLNQFYKFEYMGEVKVTEEEIRAYKYNL